MLCTICNEEVPYHTSTEKNKIVCKECLRLTKDNSKASKTTGADTLQKVFKASLDYKPVGKVKMSRITLFCNFARDKVVLFDDVGVHFDSNGYGSTAASNRSKIAQYIKMRPNRVSFVEEAPEELVREARKAAEAAKPKPKKLREEKPVEVPVVEAKVEAVVETKIKEIKDEPKEEKPKKKKASRKQKKKVTEE